MQIVTGYTGTPHVSAQDDSIRNVMLGEYGGRGVFPVLNQFEATAVTANEVRVQSGYGINQGRLFKIDRNSYDALTIENGTAGSKRADLIVARYARDEQTGIESCELVVIKGTAGSTYVDPTYTTGDILQGALQDDMPMYRVKINGIVIEEVEPLFTTYRSLIGGIEPIVSAQVDADFNSKLATNQARFDAMTAQDHAAYSQMMNDDDSAFDTWFASIQSLIDEQTATRLANAIAKHDTNFASVEASTTASKAYAVGDLLVYQNNLYKVTTAIASGGTINTASGGNVTKTDVEAVLNDKTDNMYIRAGLSTGTTVGNRATAEGSNNEASGNYSHAEGSNNVASYESAHAEGTNTEASAPSAHAEGYGTEASNTSAHAEGGNTVASGGTAHAEGTVTEASGTASHAEGSYTVASGMNSHAEGDTTNAIGISSHAEGGNTVATGDFSHAGGYDVNAEGNDSFAHGYGLEAFGSNQAVFGKYNKKDTQGDYALIVGIGTGDSASNRANGLTLDWSGNLKATSYSNLSSRKYKENIKDMTDEEARKILELNPVSYDYKSEMLPDGQFGLIAEDVEKVMTYPLVYENDEVDSIDYSKFVPALIKMVQIQQKEIDRLKELIEK